MIKVVQVLKWSNAAVHRKLRNNLILFISFFRYNSTIKVKNIIKTGTNIIFNSITSKIIEPRIMIVTNPVSTPQVLIGFTVLDIICCKAIS